MTGSTFALEVEEGFALGEKSRHWQIGPDNVTGGFHEGGEYRIGKPNVDAQLLIDDSPLEGGDDFWIWSPGYYAGQVRAELLVDGSQAVATFTLDVSPHEGKLGGDVFQAMLDEIWGLRSPPCAGHGTGSVTRRTSGTFRGPMA